MTMRAHGFCFLTEILPYAQLLLDITSCKRNGVGTSAVLFYKIPVNDEKLLREVGVVCYSTVRLI